MVWFFVFRVIPEFSGKGENCVQARLASFDVAPIQARRASECIFTGVLMHSLARRACIDNAWYFEFPRKIRRKLIVLTETAQHQKAQTSVFSGFV